MPLPHSASTISVSICTKSDSDLLLAENVEDRHNIECISMHFCKSVRISMKMRLYVGGVYTGEEHCVMGVC